MTATQKQIKSYLKTIAHLGDEEQARRLARRIKAFSEEQWLNHLREARRAGVDVGFGVADLAR